MFKLSEVLSKKSEVLYARFLTLWDTAKTELFPFQTRESATNQGENHCTNIIRHLDNMLPDDFINNLSSIEIFTLLAAVTLHDIAKIRQKFNHEEVGKEIVIENRSDLILKERQAIYVGYLIWGHGDINLRSIPEQRVYSTSGIIRIRLLAALLRLADELEMDFSRADVLTRKINQQHDNYIWQIRDAIDGIIFSPTKWKIELHASPIDKKQALLITNSYQYLIARFETVKAILNEYDLFYSKIDLVFNNDRNLIVPTFEEDDYFMKEKISFSSLKISMMNTTKDYFPLPANLYKKNFEHIQKHNITAIIEILHILSVDEDQRSIFLVGSLGAGKTSTLNYFAKSQYIEYEKDQPNNKFPVLINGSLLNFNDSWLNQAIQYISGKIHKEDAHELIKNRVIIIIDGLDEMKNFDVGKILQMFAKNVREFQDIGPKFVFSCRDHFFNENEIYLLSDIVDVIDIQKMNEIAVYSALRQLKVKNAQEVIKSLKSHAELLDLSGTPLFLKMIIETHDQLVSSGISLREMYKVYILNSLERRLSPEVSKEIYNSFKEITLISEDIQNMNLLTPGIKPIFDGIIASTGITESEFIQNLPIKKDGSNWSFTHKSFYEYFLAEKIIDTYDSIGSREITEGVRRFLHSGLKNIGVNCKRSDDKMVEIQSGNFIFGSERDGENNPLLIKSIDSFKILEIPVTNAMFLDFISSSGYSPKEERYFLAHLKGYSTSDELPEHLKLTPVVFVNWFDAYEYAIWNNGKLPTEDEFERAGRGVDGRYYPWGDEYKNNVANTSESSINHTTDVYKFCNGISPAGCYDLSGNVWEWTCDKGDRGEINDAMLVKGGSWLGGRGSARLSNRKSISPHTRDNITGFRYVV